MTIIGRRRSAPAIAGLSCGALIAVVTVLVGPRLAPAPTTPDPVTMVPGPIAVGVLPPDAGGPAIPISPGGPLLLPFPPPTTPAPPPPPGPPPIALPLPPTLSGPAGQVLAITNMRRRAAGCAPLTLDPRLTRAAQRHSEDMARRAYFSHSTPDGTTWQAREISAGFPEDRTGGENIAYGQNTAAFVMQRWMNSPPHRRNILDCEFKTIGVGYYPPGNYWTQDFGF